MSTEVQITATTVDVSSIINVLIPFVVVVLGLLLTWLTKKLAKWLGLKADSEAAQFIESAAQKALALAQDNLKQRIEGKPISIDVRNALAAEAAIYLIEAVPTRLKQLGITAEQVQKLLEARIALNTTSPETSVAVPTPAATIEVKTAGDR